MSFKTRFYNWWNSIEKPHNRYGWIPDKPDHRDHIFVGDVMPVQIMPESVDLRSMMPPIWNQLSLGSCVGHGTGAAMEFLLIKQGLTDFMPSRLFIYYNARDMEGTVNSDSGCVIRDAIKSVNTQGVCHESMWGYDITKYAIKPSPDCYTDGLQNIALAYKRIINTRPELIRLSLANGFPVVFGFTVYPSFESAYTTKTGMVMMPDPSEQTIGGHCMLVVGYKMINGKMYFICRNSWGTGFGDQGYVYMPEEYMSNPNLVSDCWSLTLIK